MEWINAKISKQEKSRDSVCARHLLMKWRLRQHLQSGDEDDNSLFPDKQDKIGACLESSGPRVQIWHLEHFNDSPVSHLYDCCMELLSVAEASPFHLNGQSLYFKNTSILHEVFLNGSRSMENRVQELRLTIQEKLMSSQPLK